MTTKTRDDVASPYGETYEPITNYLRWRMIEESPGLLARTVLGSEVKVGDVLHLRGSRGGDLRGVVTQQHQGLVLIESPSKKTDASLTSSDPLTRSHGFGKRQVGISPNARYIRWGEQEAIFAEADVLIVARREQDRAARDAAAREKYRRERAARDETWYGQVEKEFRALGVEARYVETWADTEHLQDKIWQVNLSTEQVQRLLAMLAEPKGATRA